jgi:hypothetical protein
MTSLLICAFCFFVTYTLTRRSLVWGLAASIGLGYVFGALRANILDTFAFLIWDASVLGFYASYFSGRPSSEEVSRTEGLRLWVAVLILWPVLLTLVPVQYPLIQLVGLRANVFLLPMLIIGARLKKAEVDQLAYILAGLNLLALVLAMMEYFLGLERFFPRNPVTELIYNSRDVAGFTAFRIPAFFVNAHAYAGTMVVTLPFILGAWVRESRLWRRNLLLAGMMAAILGVFLAASRSHTIVLCALMVFALCTGKVKLLSKSSVIIMLFLTGWLISNNERLQRFTTLLDTDSITERVSSSINLPFVEAALEYPFGVGIGGGGTNIPYFLRDQILQPVAAENDYVRIFLEEGLLGLGLWLMFIAWMITRRFIVHAEPTVGIRLAWFVTVAYFAMACMGTGLLTSAPQSLLLMLAAGWASAGAEYQHRGIRLSQLSSKEPAKVAAW